MEAQREGKDGSSRGWLASANMPGAIALVATAVTVVNSHRSGVVRLPPPRSLQGRGGQGGGGWGRESGARKTRSPAPRSSLFPRDQAREKSG